MSIVSVSRCAGRRTSGRSTFRKPSWNFSAFSPVAGIAASAGRQDRQILVGHRHDAAVRAVDHRDGRAPVALAADQPVAQPVVDRALADAAVRQPVGHVGLRRVAGRAGERRPS